MLPVYQIKCAPSEVYNQAFKRRGHLRMKKQKKKKKKRKACKQATRSDGSALSFLLCLFVFQHWFQVACPYHATLRDIESCEDTLLDWLQRALNGTNGFDEGQPSSADIDLSDIIHIAVTHCAQLCENSKWCVPRRIPLKKITIKIKSRVIFLPAVCYGPSRSILKGFLEFRWKTLKKKESRQLLIIPHIGEIHAYAHTHAYGATVRSLSPSQSPFVWVTILSRDAMATSPALQHYIYTLWRKKKSACCSVWWIKILPHT